MPYPSSTLFPGSTIFPGTAEAEPEAPVESAERRRHDAGVLIPKLRIPLELDESRVGLRTVEQGSEEEVAACVYAVVATPLGSRLELPGFGVEDPTFDQLPLELESEFFAAIAQWEPRASVSGIQEVEELVDNIVMEVGS